MILLAESTTNPRVYVIIDTKTKHNSTALYGSLAIAQLVQSLKYSQEFHKYSNDYIIKDDLVTWGDKTTWFQILQKWNGALKDFIQQNPEYFI